jgi:octaheme c-type cytochrome (tetrathionate reductase family)
VPLSGIALLLRRLQSRTSDMGKAKAFSAASAGLALLLWASAGTAAPPTPPPDAPTGTTADHHKFKELQQDFASGPEVTKVCLTCHTEAAKQIQKTLHWTWSWTNPKTGQKLGKYNLINDFCTSPPTNMYHCAECHVGYGFKDMSFDFTADQNVDCLVCHDTTGRYQKDPNNYGYPLKSLNLKLIAQNVGVPKRANCGDCHFRGGGGDGVKHGDLDSSLEDPGKALDVHMNAKGLNFTCVTCHKTEDHRVPGSRYAPTAADTGGAHMRGEADKTNPTTCQACHGQGPHKLARLNEHTDKIACQTCHIPAYARGDQPTEMSWDWSTAGQRGKDGKPLVKMNDDGFPTYDGGKGSFTWAENVVPTYIWFNGTVRYALPQDKLDPASQPIPINRFEGSPTDGASRIWPVKVFHGKQMWDPVNRTLVVTHLAGPPDDDAAFWNGLDMQKAVATGMAAVGRPFSGKVDFITTTMTFPITHMVAPKEQALGCRDCHVSGGRLEAIDGIYIPGRGRDHLAWLDLAGWGLAGLTLLIVLGHGLGRFISYRKGH